jgi:hypothetical protein
MHKLFVLIAAFTNVCFAQQHVPTPSIVNDPSAPVQIVSTQASLTDLLQGVTISNTSMRQVVSVKLGLIISVPKACADVPYITREHTRIFDQAIPAGQTYTFKNVGIQPAALLRFMQQHHAADAVPQLSVVGVQFASGPSWSIEKKGKAYDDTRVAVDAILRCQTASVATTPM